MFCLRGGERGVHLSGVTTYTRRYRRTYCSKLPAAEAAAMHGAAIKVAAALRKSTNGSPIDGKAQPMAEPLLGCVDLVLEPKKSKWIFKHADRCGARFVVLVAPDEWADGEKVVVKNLAESSQEAVPLADLADWFAAVEKK